MTSDFFHRPLGLVVLAAIVLAGCILNLGAAPLFDEDEGAYATVSREMVTRGNWLVPQLEDRPFFHKPPMIYWTQAASITLLGSTEFAVRLPSALASMAWALVVFILARQMATPQVAWLSVFFLITALQTSLITRAAIADALLNLFITLSLAAVYWFYRYRQKKFILLVYAAMGLGFLTKGPIAVAIPVVVTTLFLLGRKQYAVWRQLAFHPWGWLLIAAITLPWYGALYWAYGSDFLREIFWVHNWERFHAPMEGHSGPFYYYLPVILVGLLPYTALLIKAAGNVRSHWQTESGQFLMIWFGFVLLLFSFAGTKLHHYVIYGYVPLLILMAQHVPHLQRPFWLVLPLIVFLIAIIVLPLVVPAVMPYIQDEFAQIVIASARPEFGTSHLILGILFLALAVGLATRRAWDNVTRTIVAGLLFAVLVSGYLIPKVAIIMQAPIKTAAIFAREQNLPVVMWRMNFPSFSFYHGQPVLRHEPREGDIVITRQHHLSAFKAYQVLSLQHGIVLLRVEELRE